MAMRTRQTSAEWAAGVESPITAEAAVAKLQEALDYSSDAINEVLATLGGTIPSARDLMPDLYAARDKVATAHGAIQSLAERAPTAEVGANYVATGKRLGIDLIDISNETMDKAKKGESPLKVAAVVVDAGARVAEKAAGGLLSFAGRALTPLEIGFGLFLLDEIFNKGKGRKRLLKG
jgi:hypothetical protein